MQEGLIIAILTYVFIILSSVVIIQKNTKHYSHDFNRDWIDYQRGFGSVNEKTFWIGLDQIHQLTKTGSYSLEVVLKQYGVTKIVKWRSFMIGNESQKYRLSISGFDAGSSGLRDCIRNQNGMYFTTRDKDNDRESSRNCANYYGGSAWWFKACYYSNLNALKYGGSYYDETTMILKRY